MIGVVDTCYFVNKKPFHPNITKLYIPQEVLNELKDEHSRNHFDYYKQMIEVREPFADYIRHVQDINSKCNLNLSKTDVLVAALTLELHEDFCNTWVDSSNINSIEEVVCLTLDNGILQCLKHLNLYEDNHFVSKTYKYRCYSCFTIYNESLDFCKKCGLNTLTRISVVLDENNNEKILIKKNYKYKQKVLVNSRGVELKSGDQREYLHHVKSKPKSKKKNLSVVLGEL